MRSTVGLFLFTALMSAAFIVPGSAALAGGMGSGGDNEYVPHVRLLSPITETIDMTGQDSITFKWALPRTGKRGRKQIQIRIFKSRELYADNIIFNEDLPRSAQEFTMSTDIFEDGKTYVWSVRQKDRRGNWSGHSPQSFLVIK